MSSISTSFRIHICDRKLATNTLFKSHFKNFEGKKRGRRETSILL